MNMNKRNKMNIFVFTVQKYDFCRNFIVLSSALFIFAPVSS